MESEAIGTSKAAEVISYAREILRAFGTPPDGPTLIGTDNLSNLRVASTSSCPSRSKHFLRRYEVLMQRVREKEVTLRRDGVIDGCAKLKPSVVATLLKKQQAHANVSFHHKRHLGRGASTRAASDLGASERDKLKQGRWTAADAMGASYDYSLPNVSEQH